MSKRFSYDHKVVHFPSWENNYFLDNVRDTFPFLSAVYDGDIPYVPQLYPMLINTYEQLCKGVCKELLDIHKDDPAREGINYELGHRFKRFFDIISEYIQLSPSKEGLLVVAKNVKRIESLYNTTRYQTHATFDDFQSDFRRFESQLARMMTGLGMEYENARGREEKDLANY